jgi:hypothetical protein
VGPPPIGVGHPLPVAGALPANEQLTGVGPPPIGVGHPLPVTGALPGTEQLTGVGPPPIGVGHPIINSPQLTGVGPPPIGVGQPPAGMSVITGVGVAGGVGIGKLAWSPESELFSFFTHTSTFGLDGFRISR